MIAILSLMILAACGETPTESANPAATVSGSPASIISLPTLGATKGATPTTSQATPTSAATTNAAPTATPTNQPKPTVPAQPTNDPTSTAIPVVQAPDNSEPTDYHPVIWFSTSNLAIGSTLTVSGSGYPPNTKLNVALGVDSNTPTGSYASPQTDGQGRFKGQVKFDKLADGTPFQAGRIVVMVSTPDQAVAAGAPITLTGAVTPATTVPPTTAKTSTPATTQPAPASSGKHIDVNLTQQKLVAYDGSKVVYTTLISSGVAKHPTVTGTFNIYMKLVKQTMIGGTGAEAYNLPDVPYVMYFYQDYGIHGTYWHHNFGHPMSHGCVNTPTDAAHFLYDWASIGTPVTIHY